MTWLAHRSITQQPGCHGLILPAPSSPLHPSRSVPRCQTPHLVKVLLPSDPSSLSFMGISSQESLACLVLS